MTTSGSGRNGILLVGEALGKDEVVAGKPFVGAAGKLLSRLLSRCTDPETNQPLDREDFLLANAIWCRPPDNELTGAEYEFGALAHCRPNLERLLGSYKPKAIVALGNQPLRWFTGQWGIDKLRGYVFNTPHGLVVGTYHPSYIMRGNFDVAKVFQLDIRKALYTARRGIPTFPKKYTLHPSYREALAFLEGFLAAGRPPLAFDIETPYAAKDEELSEATAEDDASYQILRISFSFRGGEAISMPWIPPFVDIAKRLLGEATDLLVWNEAFDVPRLRANGAPIRGKVVDVMFAWHFLEPSLPMGLKYAATFYCPDMHAWKLDSMERPEWYSCADSDVLLRCWEGIRGGLEKQGKLLVFLRHVVEVGHVFRAMSEKGVLVDPEKRRAAREDFQAKYEKNLTELQDLVPSSLKGLKVYKKWDEKKLREEGVWKEGRMRRVVLKEWKKPPKEKKIRVRSAPSAAEGRRSSSRSSKKKVSGLVSDRTSTTVESTDRSD